MRDPRLPVRAPPVEQVDVEARAEQVLDEAVARQEVEDVRPEDQGVDQQHGHRMLLLLPGCVAVEPGFAPLPDYLPGSSSRLGGICLQEEMGTRGVLSEAEGL